MYYSRHIESFIEGAHRHFPVLILTGARQVGKTTLLRHLGGEGRRWVSLDEPLLRDLATRDPALFLQRFPPPVLLDEIQYAPGLLPLIKIMSDREGTPGAFWLTGSQPFHLMRGVSESLAGRAAVIQLAGLSNRELDGRSPGPGPFLPEEPLLRERAGKAVPLDLRGLYARIWRGSFPALAADPGLDRDLFFRSYVQTYLQRDVRDLARVGDEMAFLRFLRAAAVRSGGLLNLSDLARDADVAPNTAKSWLSVLQASGIVHLLEPWHANVSKRLVKAPKLYLADTGLCSWLAGWSSPETLEAGAASGAMLETWVVTDILKGYWNAGLEAPLFHYRDRDQKEIDLLIVRDGVVHPVEIKKSASPRPDDARHFGTIKTGGLRTGGGAIVCLALELLPLSRGVTAVPVSLL